MRDERSGAHDGKDVRAMRGEDAGKGVVGEASISVSSCEARIGGAAGENISNEGQRSASECCESRNHGVKHFSIVARALPGKW